MKQIAKVLSFTESILLCLLLFTFPAQATTLSMLIEDDNIIVQSTEPIIIDALINDNIPDNTIPTEFTQPESGNVIFEDGVFVFTPTEMYVKDDSFTYSFANRTATVTLSYPDSVLYEQNFPAVVDGLNDGHAWRTYAFSRYSGGSALRSSQKNDTIEITFYGTGITVIGYKSMSRGQFKVSWANTEAPEETMSCYAASYDDLFQEPIYTLSDLDEGLHTLTIEVLGTRGPGALGTAIDIDAFVVNKGEGLPPGEEIRLEDDNTSVQNSEPITIDVLANDVIPDDAEITEFTQPESGNVIFEDGVFVFTPTEMYVKDDSFTYSVEDSTATVMLIYEDNILYDDEMDNINYLTVWEKYWYEDTYFYDYFGGGIHSGHAGDKLEFEFYGSGVELIGELLRSMQGKWRIAIQIDEEDEVIVDCNTLPQGEEGSQTVLYRSDGCSPGLHTVKVEVLDGTTDLDAIKIYKTASFFEIPVIRVQESSEYLAFSDGWNQRASIGRFDEHIAMAASTIGASMSFSFIGNYFEFLSYKSYSQGQFDIYVDGDKVNAEPIDLYNPGADTLFQVPVGGTSVPYGEHTVTLVICGKNRMSLGHNIYIDAVNIGGTFASKNVFGVTLDKELARIVLAETTTLNARVTSNAFGNSSIIWNTNDESIATVNSDGIVAGVSTGTAIITAETVEGGYTASCAVSVVNRYQETNDDLIFEGSWTDRTSSFHYEENAKQSSIQSNVLTFRFSGTGFGIIGYKSYEQGMMDVYIDNVLQQDKANFYTSSNEAEFRQLVYSKSGLENVEHTVKLVVNGKNAHSLGHNVYIDAIEIEGVLTAPTRIPAGRVVSGDFNGDGIDDYATIYDVAYDTEEDEEYPITFDVFLSNGEYFEPMQDWTTEPYFYKDFDQITGRMVAGDFSGDGKDDIAFVCSNHLSDGTYQSYVFVFKSTGSSFESFQIWNMDHDNTDTFIGKIVASDFNNDGKDDISIVRDITTDEGRQNRIDVFKSDGSSFDREIWYTGDYINDVTGNVYTGDFDGDGQSDIAAIYSNKVNGNKQTNIHIFKSNGMSFDSEIWYAGNYDIDAAMGRITAGDFNNDGKTDIAAIYDSNNQPQIQVFRSTGASFGFSTWNTDDYISEAATGRVFAGDFNNDGKSDISMMYDDRYIGDDVAENYVFESSGTSFSNVDFSNYSEWLFAYHYNMDAVTGEIITWE